ncbi:MFS transporter [Candidatus Daviesbacteria bacterium]|nr:MFS transporter [Candidatus Daviesbacteria bacterium]
MAGKVTFTSVVKNRGFRYLWLNQILVQLSYNTLNFALIIWVFKLTDSNLAVSLLLLTIYLPAFIFGVFAGVFADISDKRSIIRMIDILLAVSILMFVFIKGSYGLILLDTFLINALGQFFIPTESSSIPMLVKKGQLFLANSLFTLTLYGSFMVGFSIAGPMLNIYGINSIFYLGAVAMTVAFLLSQNLPNIKAVVVHKKYEQFAFSNFSYMVKLTVEETRSTLKYIRGKLNIMVSIGLLATLQGGIGVLAVIMPSYMERVLRIHATDASFVLMLPLGAGMMIGALLIGRWGYLLPRRKLVIPAIVVSGILLFLAGMTPVIAHLINAADLPARVPHPRFFFRAPSLSFLFGVGSFLLGVAAVAIIVPAQTIIQESTGEAIRGKIFSVLAVMMNLFAALPVLLAGVVADLFGVTPIFVFMGAMIFIIGLLALKPQFFFEEKHLPLSLREFLGLGHWG